MAAHRYYRINVTTGNTTRSGFSEVEFHTAIGGADVTGSGTASASSVYSTYVAANAVDNNTGTAFYLNGLTGWWMYDFGAGNAFDIVEISVRGVSTASYAPLAFDFQWSDDNSSWTTLISFSGLTWVGNETKVFKVSGFTNVNPFTQLTVSGAFTLTANACVTQIASEYARPFVTQGVFSQLVAEIACAEVPVETVSQVPIMIFVVT